MKIAHIISTFPPKVGGMGKVCHEEVARLSRMGDEVVVFTMRYVGKKRLQNIDINNFTVHRLYTLFRFGDAGILPTLFWYLRRFDLVHLHYPFYGSAHFVWLAKKIFKQKYIVTFHMQARPEGLIKRVLQKIYDILFARRILSEAEKIIVVDKDYFASSSAGALVDQTKVVEIPNAVDADIFYRDLHNAEIIKKSVLFVGNLMPIKGLDTLIKAIKLLNDSTVHLHVIGDGYNIESYKKMVADYNLDEQVLFRGRVDNQEELANYYRRAWFTAVPSLTESFSLVTVEAMACGCPVIASNIPGVRGRITDGVDGFLVSAGDEHAWTNVLWRALTLTAEERNKMGEMGRQKVVVDYSWDKHMRLLEDVHLKIQNSKLIC